MSGRVCGIGFWLIAMLAAAGGIPPTAGGQEVPPDASPFLALLPALRTAPAPSWIHPGLRLTYVSAAASIDRAGGSSGGSGQGYTEITVATVNRSVVVLDLRSYSLWNGTGPAYLLGDSGAVSVPGAGLDWWINPDVLKTAAGLSGPRLQVLAGPYAINGQQYQALWFTTKSREGTQTWVYDRASGVLLHSAMETHSGGRTGLAQNTFTNMRTLNVPWASAAAPPWVAQASVLRYNGTTTVVVPGSPALGAPSSVTFQRQSFGANWARYVVTLMRQGAPQTQSIGIAGSALLDGLWVPPAGLARLRPGQILDVDPETHVRVSVGQIGRSARGTMVAITEANEGTRIDNVYDGATGMLLASTIANNILHMQLQVHLAQRQ